MHFHELSEGRDLFRGGRCFLSAETCVVKEEGLELAGLAKCVKHGRDSFYSQLRVVT